MKALLALWINESDGLLSAVHLWTFAPF